MGFLSSLTGLGGSSSRRRSTTNVTTETNTRIRDIGVTGNNAEKVIRNLATLGALTSDRMLAASGDTSARIIGASERVSGENTAASERTGARIINASERVSGENTAASERTGARIINVSERAGEDIIYGSAIASSANTAASERTGARIIEGATQLADTGLAFFEKAVDAETLRVKSFEKLQQGQSKNFNRLIGGASNLVETSGDIAEQRIIEGQTTFDNIVNAARGVADDIQQGAQATLRTTSDTIARLGPQTRQNQNIAIAGLAVAGIVAGLYVFGRK